VAQGEPADKIEFGADGEGAARGCFLDRGDDEFRRPHEIGHLHDLVAALRMDDHGDARHARTHVLHARLREASMDRTVAAPEDHFGIAQLLGSQCGVMRIPNDTVIQR